MKIGIVGVGLLGGSLAAVLKGKLKNEVEITAYSSEHTLDKATKYDLFSHLYTYDKISETVEGLDILFLCTPIKIILEHIKNLKNVAALSKKLIVTDIGSTKGVIMQTALSELQGRDDIIFIGGHPMTGNEFRGIDALDPFLYENAIYVVTPSEQTHHDDIQKLLNVIKTIGAIPLIMEPDQHDRVAAGISHLPQLMATGLVDLISKEENPMLSKTLSAGGFRDMTRIASSQYRMWEDIIDTNKKNIFGMIDNYIEELRYIKQSIEDQSLSGIFENANHTRDSIPKGTRGFIEPNFEIKVRVSDEPGILLKISKILADAEINVKDISVQKNREHEGGHFRLGFATDKDCEKALQLLQFNSYFARKIE